MRAGARGELFDGGGVFGVVVDEEPGFGRGRLREKSSVACAAASRSGTVVEAGDEARAEFDQVVEQRCALLRAQPPHAAIAFALAPGIFARQHRFADAAEPAERGGGGRAGEGGGAAVPERGFERRQLRLAAGEAGDGGDFGVQDLRGVAIEVNEVDAALAGFRADQHADRAPQKLLALCRVALRRIGTRST